jgi:hypothetical protein
MASIVAGMRSTLDTHVTASAPANQGYDLSQSECYSAMNIRQSGMLMGHGSDEV